MLLRGIIDGRASDQPTTKRTLEKLASPSQNFLSILVYTHPSTLDNQYFLAFDGKIGMRAASFVERKFFFFIDVAWNRARESRPRFDNFFVFARFERSCWEESNGFCGSFVLFFLGDRFSTRFACADCNIRKPFDLEMKRRGWWIVNLKLSLIFIYWRNFLRGYILIIFWKIERSFFSNEQG